MDLQLTHRLNQARSIVNQANELGLKLPKAIAEAEKRTHLLDNVAQMPTPDELANAKPADVEGVVFRLAIAAGVAQGQAGETLRRARLLLQSAYVDTVDNACEALYDDVMARLNDYEPTITANIGSVPEALAHDPAQWVNFDATTRTAYANVVDALKAAEPLVGFLKLVMSFSRRCALPTFGKWEVDGVVSLLPFYDVEEFTSPFLAALKLPTSNVLDVPTLVYLTQRDMNVRFAPLAVRREAEKRLAAQANEYVQTFDGRWALRSEVDEDELVRPSGLVTGVTDPKAVRLD